MIFSMVIECNQGEEKEVFDRLHQSGGRNVYLSHLHFFLSYLQVRFYLMELDCVLSTSGWLVCEKQFSLMELDCVLSTSGWLVCEKQFSLMWLASSSASSSTSFNPLILIFYFFIYVYFYFFYEATSQFLNSLTIRIMNWGEANSVYTSYIVLFASNGKIQAGALILVLVGYIITTSYGGQIRLLDTEKEAEVQKLSMEENRLDERIREIQEKIRDMSEDNTNCLKQEKYRSLPILNSLSPIQLLMQGTSLTKQERECKLYDEFDKFAYKKGISLREFSLRFSLLLNDMNIYNMKLE
ncbi:integrase, catalytic region, zinc finger, CCHC-type containing protein [Tanacetum coccineum]